MDNLLEDKIRSNVDGDFEFEIDLRLLSKKEMMNKYNLTDDEYFMAKLECD